MVMSKIRPFIRWYRFSLKNVDFFYASTIDKTNSRRIQKGPLSVFSAYRMHVKEWFTKRPKNIDALEVCYEDLLLHPKQTFRDILDYLKIELPVAESYLNVKVSQYSDEDRPRGIVRSWESRADEYKTLLNHVEKFCAKEIDELGYGADFDKDSKS